MASAAAHAPPREWPMNILGTRPAPCASFLQAAASGSAPSVSVACTGHADARLHLLHDLLLAAMLWMLCASVALQLTVEREC